MMENCLDPIVVLNDASEIEHHPVERPNCYRKLDSHISMQREALFRYKCYDHTVPSSKIINGSTLLEQAPNQAAIFYGNFYLC